MSEQPEKLTAEEFLQEFCKEIINAEPMNRQTIVKGYARHLESRELVAQKERS